MAGFFDDTAGTGGGFGAMSGNDLSMLGVLAGLGIMNGASQGQGTGQAVSGGLLGALGQYGQMQQQQAITDLRNAQVQQAKQKIAAEQAWQRMFGGAPGGAAPAGAAPSAASLPAGIPAVTAPLAGTAPMAAPAGAGNGPLGGDMLSRLPPGTMPIIGAMGREEGTKALGQFLLKQAETGQFDPPETIQLPNAEGKMVPVLAQRNRLTNRYMPVDPATTRVNVAPTINVPVNTGNSVSTELAKGLAGNMTEVNKTANAAASTLIPQLHEARTALDTGKGVISGTGADWRLGLARALNTAGATDDERVANTETYIRSTAGMVAGLVKQIGGTQISDSDRKFATEMAGGNIAFSEPGLRRILDIGERAARLSIKTNNENARKFAAAQPEAAKQLGDMLLVTEPGAYAAPPAKAAGAAAPAASQPLDTATRRAAENAILKGADKAAVLKRLQDNGYDTSSFK